ncbi:unnamed protein product [Cylindrotheca closterium]|uniref:HpcH/HpaI aldolase/citrate lyase domain-containing protein n=1 Tax=Cylindrotheca closterium TaxID=2856 RepID=A0AAD2FJF0_9STRA|nr:unnamed protein product [Cylindrotheca closterium]
MRSILGDADIVRSLVMLLSLRQHLLNGGKSYGPVCMSNSPIVMEILANSGYNHMIIDHEHAPTDIASGQTLLQAIDVVRSTTSNSIFPIVRVPDHSLSYLKKVLDSMRLPGGVLVPMIEDKETAEVVAAATKYPRQVNSDSSVDGIRGCAIPFVRASGYGTNPNYMKESDRDLLVMVQVETSKGVEAIPEISSVPGIDGIFIGPFDLSCSIGKTGQFDDPEVKDLIHRAERMVVESDCFLAGFRSGGRDLREMYEKDGYSLVCGSIDLGLLKTAALEDARVANDILHGDKKQK